MAPRVWSAFNLVTCTILLAQPNCVPILRGQLVRDTGSATPDPRWFNPSSAIRTAKTLDATS